MVAKPTIFERGKAGGMGQRSGAVWILFKCFSPDKSTTVGSLQSVSGTLSNFISVLMKVVYS